MTYGEAILYGLVQGVTEYLPVSSSAHLILLPKFLGTEDPGLTFDVFLHIGTLLATLSFFWRDWLGLFRTLPFIAKPGDPRRGDVSWELVAIATVPALIAGAILHKWVSTIFRGEMVLVCTLILGGVLLYLSDTLAKRTRSLNQAKWKDALWIGIAQCFALVPGISRSGSTMTGARLLGFDRPSSARFSFMISAPITAAAIVFELRHWDQLVNSSVALGPLLVAGVSTFVFGILAIGGLLKLLRRFGYLSFAIYRVILALVVFKMTQGA